MAIRFDATPRYDWAACAAVVLVLAGCGGGGSDQPVSRGGVVIDGTAAVAGAVVCVDLNANAICDADEPASSTDARGRYTIAGLTTDQLNSPLVAASAADATSNRVAKAYALSAPAGKWAIISPVTTMVQAGVAQGMTLQAAEAAVAAQLQIDAAGLYDDFTLSSSANDAALAALAAAIVSSLQAGMPLEVRAPAALPADYGVRLFSFTDLNNYSLRYLYAPAVPDGAGNYAYYDERVRLSKGIPVAAGSLYDSALYAGARGWMPFTGATANTTARGSPFVSNQGGYRHVNTRAESDVSGAAIADVVRLAQDLRSNSASTLPGIDPAKLTGRMPAGAKVHKIRSVGISTPVGYRASGGALGAGIATLADLAAAFAVPATPTAANTASMGGLHGALGCGKALCVQEALRVAFGAGNAATYYLCDVDTATGTQSNCTFAGTGTYAVGHAADGATPIMTFSALPAAARVQASTRVFVERGGRVYPGFQDKPATTTTTRLNKVAFEALAKALGITPPSTGDAVSAYAGTWSASYGGSDAGQCAAIAIDANGHLSGSCTSGIVGGTFTVSGTVSASGTASFAASGSTSSGASFSGTFSATSASGSWVQTSAGRSGSWAAQKLQ